MAMATEVDVPRRDPQQAKVVLGEDWVRADATAERELRNRHERRGLISIDQNNLVARLGGNLSNPSSHLSSP